MWENQESINSYRDKNKKASPPTKRCHVSPQSSLVPGLNSKWIQSISAVRLRKYPRLTTSKMYRPFLLFSLSFFFPISFFFWLSPYICHFHSVSRKSRLLSLAPYNCTDSLFRPERNGETRFLAVRLCEDAASARPRRRRRHRRRLRRELWRPRRRRRRRGDHAVRREGGCGLDEEEREPEQLVSVPAASGRDSWRQQWKRQQGRGRQRLCIGRRCRAQLQRWPWAQEGWARRSAFLSFCFALAFYFPVDLDAFWLEWSIFGVLHP